MPRIFLDPVPILDTTDSGLLVFKDNVQMNYNKIQDIMNRLDGANIKDGSITLAKTTPFSGEVVTVVSYQVAAAVGLTTSATFVDYPGPLDVTIVKKYDAATSKLVVFGTVGVYVSTGNARVDISLTIASVDHTIGTFFFNAAGTHALVPCQDDTFSGLGAGSLVGRVRWHSNGVIQINTDTNDTARFTILEVII